MAREITFFIYTGSAVYMSTVESSKSGRYSVSIDQGSNTVIDGFSNVQNVACGFGWSQAGLEDALHTIIVTTLGQSLASSNAASNFELDGFT
jgi:hypothetical protein